jgi:hypothetical protein
LAKAAEAPLRPVERRDPARTRAQILGAALTEFSQKGLAGARVDQIAARAGIDPIQLYISIAGMGGFYFFNIHTLSTVFGTDLDTRGARTTRLAHVTEVILGYLRPAT